MRSDPARRAPRSSASRQRPRRAPPASQGRVTAALLAMLLCACARTGGRLADGPTGPIPLVALLPPVNLAGKAVPLVALRDELEAALAAQGVELVPREALEKFLLGHRVRYTGGIDGELAEAAARELGVLGVLVASIDLSEPGPPAAFGVTLRLVAAERAPRVLFVDAAARTADDTPGWFEAGVLGEPAQVRSAVYAQLGSALVRHLQGRPAFRACASEPRFTPGARFVSPSFEPDARRVVAVMPFVNETGRTSAGELVALEFVRQLEAFSNVDVVEPGVVREQLLRYRILSEGGISLDTARIVAELFDADLVVTGTVHRYDDRPGAPPAVQFTAYALEQEDNAIVWQVSTSKGGDERVLFFDVGRVSTARSLSCGMVATALAQVVQPRHPAANGTRAFRLEKRRR